MKQAGLTITNAMHAPGFDEAVEEEQAASMQLEEPPMYRVILLNDDFTPMDFVIEILMRLFGKSQTQAEQIMLEVHHNGRGIAGEFTRDIAETRVAQVNQLARDHEHPLMCVMEKAQ